MNTTYHELKTGVYSVSQWLEAVRQTFTTDQSHAFVLLESPRQVLFQSLSTGLTEKDVMDASSCIVCDARAEWRLEKTAGAEQGMAHLLREADAPVDEISRQLYIRSFSYLLRNDCSVPKGSKLKHVEYFIEDTCGMLVPYSSRLAGLVQGGEA